MADAYEFTFRSDEKVTAAALKVAPPARKVRGAKAEKLLRMLHCILLMLGGVCVGYIYTQLTTGTADVQHWSTFVGIMLSYLAIFGSVFVTVPVLVRQALSSRATQGEVTMTFTQIGVRTRAEHYTSTLDWAGFEGMGRSKLGFVLWFGGNRPGVPFSAFDGPEQSAEFEADVQKWLEASR